MGDETRFSLAELAVAAGMTTRNVRAYQTRGLIPPPLRVGRRSQYTGTHLQRLRVIQRARAQGATLSLIAQHFSRGETVDLTSLPDPSGPGWLPGQRGAGADRVTGADLTPVLDRDPLAAPTVQEIVEGLISAGVVARDGRRIVAGHELVATVTALHRHGLPVDVSLTVALRAAQSAADLAGRVGAALRSGERAVVDRVAELATGVLRGVLVDGLADVVGRGPSDR